MQQENQVTPADDPAAELQITDAFVARPHSPVRAEAVMRLS